MHLPRKPDKIPFQMNEQRLRLILYPQRAAHERTIPTLSKFFATIIAVVASATMIA